MMNLKEIPSKYLQIVGIATIEKGKDTYYVYHYVKPFGVEGKDVGFSTGSQFCFEPLVTEEGHKIGVGDVCKILFGQAAKTKEGNIYQQIEEVRLWNVSEAEKVFGDKKEKGGK